LISAVNCICSFKISDDETENAEGNVVVGAGAVAVGGENCGLVVCTSCVATPLTVWILLLDAPAAVFSVVVSVGDLVVVTTPGTDGP
jgi:hypothetical protein